MPVPTPVALKIIPTLLSTAPSALKSVVPTLVIVYVSPIVKKPAVKGMRCLL